MSLVPYLIDDFYPTSLYHFGSGYHPADFWDNPADHWLTPAERRLWRSFENTGNYLRSQLSNLDELEKQAQIDKHGNFQACLDVKHFQPNELSVKTENNQIVVHAKHEEKRDNHGYITREFTRRYALPDGIKAEDVTSSLSSDGLLTIKAPHSAPAVEGNVRHIQIQQTGPARLSISNNDEPKKGEKHRKKSK